MGCLRGPALARASLPRGARSGHLLALSRRAAAGAVGRGAKGLQARGLGEHKAVGARASCIAHGPAVLGPARAAGAGGQRAAPALRGAWADRSYSA